MGHYICINVKNSNLYIKNFVCRNALMFYKWFIFVIIWSATFSLRAQEKPAQDTLLPWQADFKKASGLVDSSKYKEAIVLLKKLVKEKPDFLEAMNKMAFAKMQIKEYKEAAKDLDKAELMTPMNFETEKLKGINFYLSEKFKESKVALDTAIAIAKEEKIDDPEIHYYRALLMFKGKSYKLALGECETVLDMDGKFVKAITLKGEIRFAMKDYNYAIKELNEAIEKTPVEKTDYNSYKLRAKSKFEVRDFKGAVSDWNVYIDAIPKEEEAYIARGAAKINSNDNSSAISDLDEAIKLNPKNPISYCYRGVAKGGNKSYAEALTDLDYAIKLKFDYAEAFVNRAAIKMAIKDKRGACQDLEKADSLGDEMAIKLVERYCKG